MSDDNKKSLAEQMRESREAADPNAETKVVRPQEILPDETTAMIDDMDQVRESLAEQMKAKQADAAESDTEQKSFAERMRDKVDDAAEKLADAQENMSLADKIKANQANADDATDDDEGLSLAEKMRRQKDD